MWDIDSLMLWRPLTSSVYNLWQIRTFVMFSILFIFFKVLYKDAGPFYFVKSLLSGLLKSLLTSFFSIFLISTDTRWFPCSLCSFSYILNSPNLLITFACNFSLTPSYGDLSIVPMHYLVGVLALIASLFSNNSFYFLGYDIYISHFVPIAFSCVSFYHYCNHFF